MGLVVRVLWKLGSCGWSCAKRRPTSRSLRLPWAFVRNSTRKQQEDSLKLHAEKKALAVLLARGEAELNVSIEFNACIDCHAFFKSASLLLGRRIQLRQPKMVHMFIDGCCSCSDEWRWEARLTPTAQPMPP